MATHDHGATAISISIQNDDFNYGDELEAICGGDYRVGGLASFVGLVRDSNEGDAVSAMLLEHYPGMTEKALQKIGEEAAQRWALYKIRIIHRVGLLQKGDRIVLVAVSSAHRADAFAACAFLMDYLKTRAPFWKREQTRSGERWVEAKESDDAAAARWQ